MMRFSKVTHEGDYIPPPPANSKASYATMLFVRADIVKNSGLILSKAVTIATRYAAVRRQTAPGAGRPIVAVINVVATIAQGLVLSLLVLTQLVLAPLLLKPLDYAVNWHHCTSLVKSCFAGTGTGR